MKSTILYFLPVAFALGCTSNNPGGGDDGGTFDAFLPDVGPITTCDPNACPSKHCGPDDKCAADCSTSVHRTADAYAEASHATLAPLTTTASALARTAVSIAVENVPNRGCCAPSRSETAPRAALVQSDSGSREACVKSEEQLAEWARQNGLKFNSSCK